MSESLSYERTLRLPLVIPPATTLRFPTKDPYDTLDFTLDVTAYMADIDDAVAAWSVQSLSPSVTSLSIAKLTWAVNSPLLAANIGAGSNLQDYPLLYLIKTGTGRLISRTIWLQVLQQSAEYQFGAPVFVLPLSITPPTPPSSNLGLNFSVAGNYNLALL